MNSDQRQPTPAEIAELLDGLRGLNERLDQSPIKAKKPPLAPLRPHQERTANAHPWDSRTRQQLRRAWRDGEKWAAEQTGEKGDA